MFHRSTALLLAAACLPLAAHAAERAAPPTAATVTDAKARVPEARYQPPFSDYQPFREQKLAPWRGLNNEVHEAGGHIGIFGGARTTPAPPPASPLHPPEHKK